VTVLARVSAVALAGVSAVLAQTSQTAGAAPASPAGPAFEVASMKPASSPGLGPSGQGYSCQGGPGTAMPERWTCSSVPLSGLVSQGWNGFRIASLPPGLSGPRWDIAARVPPGTSMEDFRLMIRRLLEERIGLAVHAEKREIKVTELVVAKGGIKMKEAEPPPPGAEPPPLGNSPRFAEQISNALGSTLAGGVTLGRDGIPQVPPGFRRLITTYKDGATVYVGRMIQSAEIARVVSRPPPYPPVVDKTGLTGKYDFTLIFDTRTLQQSFATPAASPDARGGGVPEAIDPGLTYEAALKKLGLEFHDGTEMVDFLVVDHFNSTPSEN